MTEDMVLWLHLREAVRALRLAVEQPLPQALLVEGRAAARQAHRRVRLEGAEADPASRLGVRIHRNHLPELILGRGLLRGILVQDQEGVVVVGGNIAVHQCPDDPTRQSAFQDLVRRAPA